MKQIYLSLFFTFLLSFSISSQQSKIDSLKSVLKKEIHDTVRLNIYHDLTRYYTRRDLVVAEKYCDSLKSLSDSKSISKFQIDYYVLKGTLEFYRQNIDGATIFFKDGLAHKKIDSFFYLKSSLINNVAVGFQAQKKLDSFVKYMKYYEDLNFSRNNTEGLLTAYFNLSNYYSNISDYQTTSIYLDKLTKLAVKTNNKESLARTNILLAQLSRKELDYESAINQFKEAIKIYENFNKGNTLTIRAIEYEIARTYILSENYLTAIKKLLLIKNKYLSHSKEDGFSYNINQSLLDCYIKTFNYNKAKPLYSFLKNDNKSRGKLSDMVHMLTLCEYEIKFDNLNDKTLTNLLLVRKSGIEAKSNEITYLSEKSIAEYYSKKKDYKSSFFHLNNSLTYKDSMSSRNSKIINLAHKRKFNEELKEKENLQLKADNAEQKLLTQKANMRNWLLAIGLLALCISAFFIWRRYKSEAKAKQIISEQKTQIEKLQKEFHHRLKNDFRSINSYIGLIQRQFTDTNFKERLNELKNRVTSMFKVHEILLQEDDITQVKAHPYLLELSQNVEDKYSNKNIKVTCNVDKTETIVADKAIPFGIVLNEFVTNSYKYAFDEKGGEINIDFKSDKDNHYLILKDNGKGLSDDFNIENLRSLGMSIIPMFADLHDGSYQLDGNNGVSLTLTLPKKVA